MFSSGECKGAGVKNLVMKQSKNFEKLQPKRLYIDRPLPNQPRPDPIINVDVAVTPGANKGRSEIHKLFKLCILFSSIYKLIRHILINLQATKAHDLPMFLKVESLTHLWVLNLVAPRMLISLPHQAALQTDTRTSPPPLEVAGPSLNRV